MPYINIWILSHSKIGIYEHCALQTWRLFWFSISYLLRQAVERSKRYNPDCEHPDWLRRFLHDFSRDWFKIHRKSSLLRRLVLPSTRRSFMRFCLTFFNYFFTIPNSPDPPCWYRVRCLSYGSGPPYHLPPYPLADQCLVETDIHQIWAVPFSHCSH